MILIAILSDLDASHQFHHEIRAAGLGCPGVKHPRNVRMVHHRQRLPLRLKPGDDVPRVHAELDHLECHTAANRLHLFGDIDHAAAAFSQFFADFVRTDDVAWCLGRRRCNQHGPLGASAQHRLKELAGMVVRPKQNFDAPTNNYAANQINGAMRPRSCASLPHT